MSNQEAASYFSESGSVFTGEDTVDNAAFLSSNNDAAQVQIANGSSAKLGLAARKAPNLPKLRDIFRCNKLLSEDGYTQEPDFEFHYADSDSYTAELADLYCYSEEPEFLEHWRCFKDWAARHNFKKWKELSPERKTDLILGLLDEYEVADCNRRNEALEITLYLLQGCFKECSIESECLTMIQENAYLLYSLEVFAALCDMLASECDQGYSQGAAIRKTATSLGDCKQIRYILCCLYTFVETLRRENFGETSTASTAMPEAVHHQMRGLREKFISELGLPLCGGQPLPLLLFNMVTRFCSANAPHFPMRKVLLLLWKTLLSWLGGFDALRRMKDVARQRKGLPPCAEDTLEVAKYMHAAPAPALLVVAGPDMDLAEPVSSVVVVGTGRNQLGQAQRFGTGAVAPPAGRPLARRQLACATGGDDDDDADSGAGMDSESTDGDNDAIEMKTSPDQEPDSNSPSADPNETAAPIGSATERGGFGRARVVGEPPCHVPRPLKRRDRGTRALPWAPKIRQKDIEMYLEGERLKFFGFQLPEDRSTVAGLPRPIQESLDALKKHIYLALSEVQILDEEKYQKYFFSHQEPEVEQTPAEQLYQMLLPQMPQYCRN